MKRIAIIGSASFLARNFIQYSHDLNLEYSFELYDFVEQKDETQYPYKQINFSDINSVALIDYSVDIIMIFIGKTGTVFGFDQYKEFIEVNEVMLLNILQCYINSNSRARIIYPSSRLSFKSNEESLISELGERECKSIYAVTKQAAEMYLEIYNNVFDIRYTILRICTPFGSLFSDFGNYGTFEIFKNQAIEKKEITIFGDGSQRKTFTSMEDICKAFSILIDNNPRYKDYNLGGQALSLYEIAFHIAEEFNVPIKMIPWPEIYQKVDGGSVVFDSSRFDSEFGMKYKSII